MRVERILIRQSDPNYSAVKAACNKARSLYNVANYLMRQSFFDKTIKKASTVDKELKQSQHERYRALPSSAAQRTTQVLGDNWKSYFASVKEYRKNPSRFEKQPKPPKYKKTSSTFYIGRNGFSVKNGELHMPKLLSMKPIKIACCFSQIINSQAGADTTIQDVRFVPTGNAFFIELVYKLKPIPKVLLDRSNALGIDLGINNLATIVSNQQSVRPVLINGKMIKSVNAKYNKDCATLRSKGNHSHLKSKSVKRLCWINDYLHKVSRFIISQALMTNSGTIVIGHNPEWKKSINIGKVNNQKFVSIPHARLIEMIQYKGDEIGLDVIVREESYTSKASALDLDAIPNYGDPGDKVFSGKRRKRGLYVSADGRKLNADINGAINILRKEIGDDFVKGLADKGCVFQPKRVNVLALECDLRVTEAQSIAA